MLIIQQQCRRVRRIIHIYMRLTSQNIKTVLEYKFDFFIMSASSIITCSLGIIFLMVIFNSIPQINNWTLEQIMFIYGMVVFSEGIASFFFEGVWSLPYQVSSGGFDKYLYRPISPALQILASKIGINGAGNIVLGSVIISYSLLRCDIAWSVSKIAIYIIMIFSAMLISISVNLAANSVSFWLKSAGIALPVSINSFHEFGKYPATLYNKLIQVVLLFGIPYAFIGYIPATFLFEKGGWNALWYFCPLVSIYSVILSLMIFYSGVKKYESAGN